MEYGQLIEAGTHDELLALSGIYAGLWNIQQNAKVAARWRYGNVQFTYILHQYITTDKNSLKTYLSVPSTIH